MGISPKCVLVHHSPSLQKKSEKIKESFLLLKTLICGGELSKIGKFANKDHPNFHLGKILSLSVLLACVFPISGKRLYCPIDSRTSWPTNRVNTTQKLIWLRNEMNRATSVRGPTLDAFIVTFHDEHQVSGKRQSICITTSLNESLLQGEFLAERDKRLQYISGFSGPYGYAVVTRSKAAFWTDFRYYDQADEQLDCNWILMKLGDPGVRKIRSIKLYNFELSK